MTYLARTSRAAGGAALLAAGALALHQLSYLLVHGGGAGAALERSGHGYLDAIAPLLVALATALVIVSVLVPALVRRAPFAAGGPCVTERAAAYAIALLAVYFAQELAEGALATGHPGGLGVMAATGGWLALPLAMALGAAAAVVREWLFRTEWRIARALAAPRRLPRAPRRAVAPAGSLTLRLAALSARPLSFGLARRPPPPVLA